MAAKHGEQDKSELVGAAREMFDTMSEDELEDLASTKRSDLPEKTSDE